MWSDDDTKSSAIPCKSHFAEMVIPDKEALKKYLFPMGVNFYDLENDFFFLVSTLTYNCKDQQHLGPPEDGGWDVCLERRFDIQSPCLVYSFGIGNDFRFESSLQELLKCEVHAFDPSMGVESYQFSSHGFFHNFGISNINTQIGKWKLKRLSSIMGELGHTGRTLDLVKMDIEFSEWPALYDMISSGLINSVRQLVLEVHTPEMDIHQRPNNKCTWTTLESMAFIMRTLIDLKNLGFSLFYSRTNYRTKFLSPLTNQDRYCCHDLHFVNVKHERNRWIKE